MQRKQLEALLSVWYAKYTERPCVSTWHLTASGSPGFGWTRMSEVCPVVQTHLEVQRVWSGYVILALSLAFRKIFPINESFQVDWSRISHFMTGSSCYVRPNNWLVLIIRAILSIHTLYQSSLSQGVWIIKKYYLLLPLLLLLLLLYSGYIWKDQNWANWYFLWLANFNLANYW